MEAVEVRFIPASFGESCTSASSFHIPRLDHQFSASGPPEIQSVHSEGRRTQSVVLNMSSVFGGPHPVSGAAVEEQCHDSMAMLHA